MRQQRFSSTTSRRIGNDPQFWSGHRGLNADGRGCEWLSGSAQRWRQTGAQSLYRRWRILQAFFVRSLPHSGSHLSPMRSRSDLLRGHLRTGGPARAAERGSAALSGNSARSRHARGAEPSLSRPTAMRDGSWSLRSARRTLRAPGQHGIDRSALAAKPHLDWGSAVAAADRRRRFCASHSYVVVASAADFAVHLDDWAHGSPGHL